MSGEMRKWQAEVSVQTPAAEIPLGTLNVLATSEVNARIKLKEKALRTVRTREPGQVKFKKFRLVQLIDMFEAPEARGQIRRQLHEEIKEILQPFRALVSEAEKLAFSESSDESGWADELDVNLRRIRNLSEILEGHSIQLTCSHERSQTEMCDGEVRCVACRLRVRIIGDEVSLLIS